jgi:4a-hydroxytetrahydrobiopterin dehydratase
MEPLFSRTCEACKPNAPHATQSEVAQYLLALPNWSIERVNDVPRLIREYTFKNYSESLAFLNAVAKLADSEGHHPLMILEIRKVNLQWWSHKIKGLHMNDFIMAAKSDEIFNHLFENSNS